MRHPFDGVNQPEIQAAQGESAQPAGLSRRSALGRMVFAAAGFVGLQSAAQAQIATTNAIGEEGGAPNATTLALGEEGALTGALNETGIAPVAVTTEPFGEEAGRVTSRAVAGLEDGGKPAPTTEAAREEGAAITQAVNEQGGGVITTQALGEEGATTRAVNEEGATTKALNEEGATTNALREEGAGLITRARGEEGLGATVTVPPLARELTPKQLEATWTEMGDKESAKALQACAVLYGAKQAIPFLKEHLKVNVPAADPQRIAQLIADLDADAFTAREKAQKELEQLGMAAQPAIREALEKTRSVEAKMRLQRLIDGSKDAPALLQAQRGLEVLVALKTPEARAVVEKLAGGPEKDWLTQAAKSALARMPK